MHCQGEATVRINFSFLQKRDLLWKNFLINEYAHFWKGFSEQECKQAVAKIFSLVKMAANPPMYHIYCMCLDRQA